MDEEGGGDGHRYAKVQLWNDLLGLILPIEYASKCTQFSCVSMCGNVRASNKSICVIELQGLVLSY